MTLLSENCACSASCPVVPFTRVAANAETCPLWFARHTSHTTRPCNSRTLPCPRCHYSCSDVGNGKSSICTFSQIITLPCTAGGVDGLVKVPTCATWNTQAGNAETCNLPATNNSSPYPHDVAQARCQCDGEHRWQPSHSLRPAHALYTKQKHTNWLACPVLSLRSSSFVTTVAHDAAPHGCHAAAAAAAGCSCCPKQT